MRSKMLPVDFMRTFSIPSQLETEQREKKGWPTILCYKKVYNKYYLYTKQTERRESETFMF